MMKLYLDTNLYISSLKVTPIKGVLSLIRAKVELVFNQQIRIGGIQLLYGQYGYYLSWPSKIKINPLVTFYSNSVREKIIQKIIQFYVKSLQRKKNYAFSN